MSAPGIVIEGGIEIGGSINIGDFPVGNPISFVIAPADIVSSSSYFGDPNVVPTPSGFYTVPDTINSQIAAPYQATINGTPYANAITAFTDAGYTTSDSYVWNVNWSGYTPTIGSLNFGIGGSGYLTVPNSSGFDQNSASFTVECWAYPNAGGAYWIYNQQTPGFFGLYYAGGTFNISQNGSSNPVNGVTSCPLNAWYHVAMCLDFNSDVITLYINGVSQGSQSVSGFTNSQDVVSIGASDNIGSYPFAGYITNLRVTQSSGSPVYTGDFTPPTTTLQTTQSAGTNISAITPGQVQLLLNANFQIANIVDTSQNGFIVTNTGGVIWNSSTPYSAPATINNYSGPARVYVGQSNQIWIIPIDTTFSGWQINIASNVYTVPCEIGTFIFPATFTPYSPTTDAGNAWC